MSETDFLCPKHSNHVNIHTTAVAFLHALNDSYISEAGLSQEEYYYKHSRRSMENDHSFISSHLATNIMIFPSFGHCIRNIIFYKLLKSEQSLHENFCYGGYGSSQIQLFSLYFSESQVIFTSAELCLRQRQTSSL